MPALATSQIFLPHEPEGPISAPSLEQDVQNEFDRQLTLLIEQHKSYPSIVTWVSIVSFGNAWAAIYCVQVIYNEGWGQPWENYNGVHNVSADFVLTDLVRKHDPSRLINSVTGWHDHGAGDFHVSIFPCL